MLDFYFSKLYETGSSDQVDRIRKSCYNLVADYQEHMNATIENDVILNGFIALVVKEMSYLILFYLLYGAKEN